MEKFHLDSFKLQEGDFVFKDTLYLEDEIKSYPGNAGFHPISSEVLESKTEEGFEIRRCLYTWKFVIYSDNTIFPAQVPKNLVFQFEAFEIWENGEVVAEPNFHFEKLPSHD